MTKNQLEILSHMLRGDRGSMNGIFMVSEGADYDDCIALEADGYVNNLGKSAISPDTIFKITSKGRAAYAGATS